MNRRRFIVTSISAAAVGTALATDACSMKSGGLSPTSLIPDAFRPGAVHTLTAQYAVTDIKGYKLRTRTYNGKTVGPTIETKPGETMSFHIVNDLPPDPPTHVPYPNVKIPAPMDSMEAMDPKFHRRMKHAKNINPINNPHGFNTTNLHVHGIQTVPHIFEPVGTSDPHAMMIMIEPGKTYRYDFPIPHDHPSGLHWYHPHKHGSTDVQVAGGMAGLIVVRGPIDEVPEIAAAREIFLTVQTLNVNPGKKDPNVYEREYVAYKPPTEGGYSFGTQFTMVTVNGEGAYWVKNATKTTPAVWEPLGHPQFHVRPGEVVRVRLLNGTNSFPLFLTLPGFECWQIGFDGVNLLKPKLKDMSGEGTIITPANLFNGSKQRLAAQGNRIELLIKAPDTEGIHKLSSCASDGIFPSSGVAFTIADFVVSGTKVDMKIPDELPKPTREYPVIHESDLTGPPRKFVFKQGPREDLLTGFGFWVNDELYQEEWVPTRPKVGTMEQWEIVNETDDLHPFHLHENSFQLIAVNGEPNEPMEVWDTFAIPPKVGDKNGSLTIRVRFVQWHGKTVFHCHVLPHEDTGMMQNILME